MNKLRKNILFIVPSLANGGQEKAGMILTNYLNNYHNVLVVTFEAKNELDFNYLSPKLTNSITSCHFIIYPYYFFYAIIFK